MKKVFFQQSGLFLFFTAIILSLFVYCVVGIIYFIVAIFRGTLDIPLVCLALLGDSVGVGLTGFELIRMIRQVIILEEKSLYVPNEWGMSDEKVQYEVKLQYCDIVNMYLRETTNDSHNKPMKRYAYVTLPKTYLVLCDAKGKEFAVNIVFYTKNCRIKIIDSIIYRMELQGNNSCNKTGKGIYEDFLKKRNNRKV